MLDCLAAEAFAQLLVVPGGNGDTQLYSDEVTVGAGEWALFRSTTNHPGNVFLLDSPDDLLGVSISPHFAPFRLQESPKPNARLGRGSIVIDSTRVRRYVPFPSYARVRNHRCISGTRNRQSEPSDWTNNRRRNELWMAGSAGGGWLS